MSHNKDNYEKGKFERDDAWNRAYFGNPTVGGLLVIIAIILFIVFNSKW